MSFAIIKLDSNNFVAEEVPMQIVLLVLAFVFLGVIAPVFLIAIAAPWSFSTTLAVWTALMVISMPLGWVVLGKKRLV